MIHHDSQSKPKAPLIDIDSFNCPSGGDSFFYKTSDGVNLRIAIWNETSSKGTILLQSGRTEFIEKYYEVIQEFVNRGFLRGINGLERPGFIGSRGKRH